MALSETYGVRLQGHLVQDLRDVLSFELGADGKGKYLNDALEKTKYVNRRADHLAACGFAGIAVSEIAWRNADTVFNSMPKLSVQEIRRRELKNCISPLLPMPTTANTDNELDELYRAYPAEEWTPAHDHTATPNTNSYLSPEKAAAAYGPPVAYSRAARARTGKQSSLLRSVQTANNINMDGTSEQTPLKVSSGELPPTLRPDPLPLRHATRMAEPPASPTSPEQSDPPPMDVGAAAAAKTEAELMREILANLGRNRNAVQAESVADNTSGDGIPRSTDDPHEHQDPARNSRPSRQSLSSQKTVSAMAHFPLQQVVKPQPGKRAAAASMGEEFETAADDEDQSEAQDDPPRKPVSRPRKKQKTNTDAVDDHFNDVVTGKELPRTADEAKRASTTRLAQLKADAKNRKRKDPLPEFFDKDRFFEGEGDEGVRCPCGVVEDDHEHMVACDGCGVWQHSECMGFELTEKQRKNKKLELEHLCQMCDPWKHRELIQGLRQKKKDVAKMTAAGKD